MKLLLTIGVAGMLLASISQGVQARDHSSDWDNDRQQQQQQQQQQCDVKHDRHHREERAAMFPPTRKPWHFHQSGKRVINANELNMNAQIGGLQTQVNSALAAGTMSASAANVLTAQINALAAQERSMIGDRSLSDRDFAILQASVQNEQMAVTGAIAH